MASAGFVVENTNKFTPEVEGFNLKFLGNSGEISNTNPRKLLTSLFQKSLHNFPRFFNETCAFYLTLTLQTMYHSIAL